MTRELATFGGGCFWCTEAVFKRLTGVEKVTSGYSGGRRENPSYDQVSTGATGHAEAVQVEFNPTIIPFDRLLDVFFATHDPTTKNQQGADIGSQYRSVIFYHSDKQKQAVEQKIKQLTSSVEFTDPIVTELVPFEKFYTAEEYHKDYYDQNSTKPYCMLIINPKINKLLEKFGKEVKEEYKK